MANNTNWHGMTCHVMEHIQMVCLLEITYELIHKIINYVIIMKVRKSKSYHTPSLEGTSRLYNSNVDNRHANDKHKYTVAR